MMKLKQNQYAYIILLHPSTKTAAVFIFCKPGMPSPARFLSMVPPEASWSPPTYKTGDSMVAATHTLPELLQSKPELYSTCTPFKALPYYLLGSNMDRKYYKLKTKHIILKVTWSHCCRSAQVAFLNVTFEENNFYSKATGSY